MIATSTSVERTFSKGRKLLEYTRNRLSATAVRQHICLGAWCRSDLVSVNDIETAIKSTKKRERVVSVSESD
jgi:hypothetical protein